jgi:hypothetical protein
VSFITRRDAFYLTRPLGKTSAKAEHLTSVFKFDSDRGEDSDPEFTAGLYVYEKPKKRRRKPRASTRTTGMSSTCLLGMTLSFALQGVDDSYAVYILALY